MESDLNMQLQRRFTLGGGIGGSLVVEQEGEIKSGRYGRRGSTPGEFRKLRFKLQRMYFRKRLGIEVLVVPYRGRGESRRGGRDNCYGGCSNQMLVPVREQGEK